MRSDNMDEDPLVALEKRMRRGERGSDLGYSSISEGSLRVASAEGLIVEGSQKITGTLFGDGEIIWTGTAKFQSPGTLEAGDSTFEDVKVTQTLDVTASAKFQSSVEIMDTLDVTATTRLRAATTVEDDLTVTGAGKIIAGVITIDGTSGGRIASSGDLSLVAPFGSEVTVTGGFHAYYPALFDGNVTVLGDFTVAGAKSFGMEHPSKPGVMLRHGSTESPVSGIEYWGEGKLDADGQATITLPDYFDALAKPHGRTVFVTGRGHSPDWSDIDTDHFTVTGSPGGRFSWLVKAERFGGDFELEQPMPETSNE